jgi:Heavy-metal-associated domain
LNEYGGGEYRMETTNEKERLARITIPVTGMTCASCVRRVERTLSKKEGVIARFLQRLVRGILTSIGAAAFL